MAMTTVAEILDKFSKTSGNNLYMASLISKVHVVKAMTHWLAHRDARPYSKHFIHRCWRLGSKLAWYEAIEAITGNT